MILYVHKSRIWHFLYLLPCHVGIGSVWVGVLSVVVAEICNGWHSDFHIVLFENRICKGIVIEIAIIKCEHHALFGQRFAIVAKIGQVSACHKAKAVFLEPHDVGLKRWSIEHIGAFRAARIEAMIHNDGKLHALLFARHRLKRLTMHLQGYKAHHRERGNWFLQPKAFHKSHSFRDIYIPWVLCIYMVFRGDFLCTAIHILTHTVTPCSKCMTKSFP